MSKSAPDTSALPADATPRPEDEVEMGFFAHLNELRKRIIRALLGVIPAMFVTWAFKENILDYLLAPWVQAWRKLGLGTPQIHFAGPLDMFIIYLKNSFIAGLVLVSPWVFYQLWQFIAPGLYRRERLMAIPFVLGSTACFVGGVAFGYIIVFPLGFETFLEYSGELPRGDIEVVPTVMVKEYMSLVTRLLLGFGIVFEVPVVVTFLAALDIVDWKGLLKFARWWILCATFLAAFLTPPDVVSQLAMLVPLIVLYFVAVGIAWVIGLRRKKAKEDDPALAD